MPSAHLPFQPLHTQLQTPRLAIRVDTETSYAHWFRTADVAALQRRFGLDAAGVAQQRAKVEGGLSTYRTAIVFFHLCERGSGEVVGNGAFHNWYPEHRRSEIGYAVNDGHRQQGYMREALPAILAFGFGEMDLDRIEAFIDPVNTPSVRLVERLGFRREGLLRQHYRQAHGATDSAVYGLLRSEFDAAVWAPLP